MQCLSNTQMKELEASTELTLELTWGKLQMCIFSQEVKKLIGKFK